MDILITLITTVVVLILIVWVCALFTNAIEWVGHRFKLSEGAVGSVLAAVGTALPETLVPVVALLSGLMAGTEISREDSHAIGIGAILGAPFLLSTLAMHVSGIAVFYYSAMRKRDINMHLSHHLFRRDVHYFLPAYLAVFLAAFIADTWVKTLLAIALVVFYGVYVYRTLKKEHIPDAEFHLEPLTFAPKVKEPNTPIILLQVFASLVALVVLAHLFVEQISVLSKTFGMNALILSLIIAPIATELPEKANSVVWLGKKKDNLALGNITGAMVFQSTIPTAIGLAFTPWVLSTEGYLSVFLCLGSILTMYFFAFRKSRYTAHVLLLGGVFYLVFLGYALLPLLGLK